MNSTTAYGKADLSNNTLMATFPPHGSAGWQRRQRWKAQGIAYTLALLAHFALWQLYQAIPATPPPEEPPIIEASLVFAPQAPVAAAPALPEPPQVQPPPKQPKPQLKPKPIPKPEKPVVKKPDRPKPVPKPVPKPQPQAEAEPAPPAPAAEVEEAPPAPVATPKAAPKVEAESAENTRISGGSVTGFDRSSNSMPRIARERGWEGTTTLKFKILASGEIEGIAILSSSGHEVLDERAIEMLENAHVTPCRKGDTPVDCPGIRTLPIQFKLEKH